MARTPNRDMPPLARAVELHLLQQLAAANTGEDRAELKAALDMMPQILEAGMRIKRMSRAELEHAYALRCAEVVKLSSHLRQIMSQHPEVRVLQ